ncbi:MAG: hypothetical protein KJ072_27145 [Verrucomicrobia bacterium]|nr:hypothetical protein [Verrucomicrobiota bacterium]
MKTPHSPKRFNQPFAAALLAMASALSLQAQALAPDLDFAPDEIIVQFNTNADEPQLADALALPIT